MGKLLKTVELEHQHFVQRLTAWAAGVPDTCSLGVEDYLVTSLWWQALEKTVSVEMVVSILYVVRWVGWRERYVSGYHLLREMHFPRGPRVIWSNTAEVSAVSVRW